MVSNDMFPKRK